MSQQRPAESKFISLNLREKPASLQKDLKLIKASKNSMLTILLDRFYNQKPSRDAQAYPYIDKAPLEHFLTKFGLGGFTRFLAMKGYTDKITDFFFIREKCFNKTLEQLKVNQEQRELFVQLRKELISVRLDHESEEASKAGKPFEGAHPIAYSACTCCRRQSKLELRLKHRSPASPRQQLHPRLCRAHKNRGPADTPRRRAARPHGPAHGRAG